MISYINKVSTMKSLNNFPTAKLVVLSLGLFFAQGPSVLAQVSDPTPQPVSSDAGQSLVSSVASYRDDVRQSVLLVSQQPQVLTHLAQQQASSQQAFDDLIHSFGQTKQGWFYDIARFPDVLHTLATLPDGTDRQTVQGVTKALPANVQETAWKLYRHHHGDLEQVDNLNQQAAQAFNTLIAPLDGPTQTAFRQLINMPDVLSLLTQQLDETTKLGRDYQVDPASVSQNLTALHDKLDAQNKQELADYQRQLDQDPQARQELAQAGKAYAQANGINPNPAWPNNPVYYQNPYSFWFGYPTWYGSPMWYPSAFGYGAGFYYGPGGNMIVYGLPSFGFSNWFFNYGYGYYPRLYNRFNNYYTYTVGARRVWSPTNAGFVGAAHRAFGPVNSYAGSRSGRLGGLGSPRPYGGTARVAAPMSRYQGMNTGGFRTQSFGGSFGGGGMRSFGGGGGFHGGGRR